MGREPARRVALMAIREHYAEAIFDGKKLVEFRKRRLAADIENVWVYATAPVSKIVGRFSVSEIVEGTPQEIWAAFGSVGSIRRADFFQYFEGATKAVAIVVGQTERISDPLALADIDPRPAVPQSFAYLPADTLALA